MSDVGAAEDVVETHELDAELGGHARDRRRDHGR